MTLALIAFLPISVFRNFIPSIFSLSLFFFFTIVCKLHIFLSLHGYVLSQGTVEMKQLRSEKSYQVRSNQLDSAP